MPRGQQTLCDGGIKKLQVCTYGLLRFQVAMAPPRTQALERATLVTGGGRPPFHANAGETTPKVWASGCSVRSFHYPIESVLG